MVEIVGAGAGWHTFPCLSAFDYDFVAAILIVIIALIMVWFGIFSPTRSSAFFA